MRKTIFDPNQTLLETASAAENCLNLATLAQVTLSSEALDHPIESALFGDSEEGWRASAPGEQTIRIIFDQALNINQILLIFEEHTQQRTQEFVLRWSTDNQSFQEILRQQFHFSPPDTTLEIENYTVNLHQLKSLELNIIPDLNDKLAYAGLKQLRLV